MWRQKWYPQRISLKQSEGIIRSEVQTKHMGELRRGELLLMVMGRFCFGVPSSNGSGELALIPLTNNSAKT